MLEVLDQAPQGAIEIDVVDVDHRSRVSAADTEVEAPGRQPLQGQRLRDEGEGMAGEGGDDRRAEGDALGLHGRGGEERERVETGGRHHHPGVSTFARSARTQRSTAASELRGKNAMPTRSR